MLRKAEGREPGAMGSAVFPCRLAGDKCPRHYSLTMHINLGLAFPAHLCSMFQRLRKQLVASHELLPRASVYSNALANCERMGPCWGGGTALAAPGQVSNPTDTERERALSPPATLRKGLCLGVARIFMGLEA